MSNRTLTQFPSGSTQYRIGFDYLARPFVVVSLVNPSDVSLNKVLTVGTDYRFLTPTIIEMLVDQTGYAIVQIHRSTATDLVVDFRDGSVLTAKDLTNAELQAIHIAEEGRDQTIDRAKEYADAAEISAGKAADSEDIIEKLVEDMRSAALMGYITKRSFEAGFTVTQWNEVLLWEAEGEYYRWDGLLPKVVPAGSTPESTGGVGRGKWFNVGDGSLRGDLNTTSGAGMVVSASGKTVQDEINALNKRIDTHRHVVSIKKLIGLKGETEGDTILVHSYHNGTMYGGGTFVWTNTPKSQHNGGTIIDPDKAFPAAWDDAGKTSWFAASNTGTGVWKRTGWDGTWKAEHFGAMTWAVGDAHDSTVEFQKVATLASRGGTWRWFGRHRITSFIDIPPKQTFGSYGQMTSVYSELFQPSNFMGIHVIADPSLARTVNHAVFLDMDSGCGFRCGEGAVPDNFLIYGKGITEMGRNVAVSLPKVPGFYDVAAFRHNKAINPRNVTVAMCRYAFDSNPWDASVGDYYTDTNGCVAIYVGAITRLMSSQDITFNTKHTALRAYVAQIGDYGKAARNVTFTGGSIEGYNTGTIVRGTTQLSFDGVYFETGATDLTDPVFNLVGWCTLNFENCLVYMNGTTQFVSSGGASQSAGVYAVTINSTGNTWRKTDTVKPSVVYNVDPVARKQVDICAEVLNKATGASLGMWAGSVPPGKYTAPVEIPI